MTPAPTYTARRVCVLAVVPDIAEVAAKAGRHVSTTKVVRLIPNVGLVIYARDRTDRIGSWHF